jgi:bacterioferritin
MKRGEYEYKLKEFYTLETFQVRYYRAQLSAPQDEYYRKAFEKMVKIEAGHADYFAQKLTKEGLEIPPVVEPLFKVAGRLLGETAELSGPYNTCRLGVALENKAMEMYRDFIMRGWGDQELRDTLIDYLLDEEFHTLWMEGYMRHLAPAPKLT